MVLLRFSCNRCWFQQNNLVKNNLKCHFQKGHWLKQINSRFKWMCPSKVKLLSKTFLLGQFYILTSSKIWSQRLFEIHFQRTPILKDSVGPILSESMETCRINLIFIVHRLSRFSKTQKFEAKLRSTCQSDDITGSSVQVYQFEKEYFI